MHAKACDTVRHDIDIEADELSKKSSKKKLNAFVTTLKKNRLAPLDAVNHGVVMSLCLMCKSGNCLRISASKMSRKANSAHHYNLRSRKKT